MAKRPTKTRSYYFAVGRFIDRFATVEKILHVYFFNFAKIDHRVANAIKRGMKAAELVSIIKGLLAVNSFKPEAIKEANDIFEQFAHIAAFRDRVIHRGASERELGKFHSSNVATMRSIEGYEEALFTIQDIKNATHDLLNIGTRIMIVSQGLPKNAFRKRVFSPWRYKSVVLRTPYLQRPPKLQSS